MHKARAKVIIISHILKSQVHSTRFCQKAHNNNCCWSNEE